MNDDLDSFFKDLETSKIQGERCKVFTLTDAEDFSEKFGIEVATVVRGLKDRGAKMLRF